MSKSIIPSDFVLKRFEEDVIGRNIDTKSSDWLKLSQEIEELVLHAQGYEINLLSPQAFIQNAIFNKLIDISFERFLDKLENAFYSLSLFALNLCRAPQKRDYQHIKVSLHKIIFFNVNYFLHNVSHICEMLRRKQLLSKDSDIKIQTYNGFYVHNIASVMHGEDVRILQSMGYIISAQENEDEFTLQHVNQNIVMLAFQLYLAQLYCRRVKMNVLNITGNDYGDDVAMALFEHFDKPNFHAEQIDSLCKLKQSDLKKEKVRQQRHETQERDPVISNDRFQNNAGGDGMPQPALPPSYNNESWQTTPAYHHQFQPNSLLDNQGVDDDDLYGSPESSGNAYRLTHGTTHANNLPINSQQQQQAGLKYPPSSHDTPYGGSRDVTSQFTSEEIFHPPSQNSYNSEYIRGGQISNTSGINENENGNFNQGIPKSKGYSSIRN